MDRLDSLAPHFIKAINELRLDSEESVNEKQFMREVARMEKHCLVSFANLIFKSLDSSAADPDLETVEAIKAGIESEEIEKEELKELLRKSLSLHTPDVDIYIPPKDRNTWMRFRNCTSAFYDVVTDPVVSMKSSAEIFVANQEMKQYI